MRAALLSLAILLAGCRHTVPAFTLAHDARTIVWSPEEPPGELRVVSARKAKRSGCDAKTSFADLRWTGHTAHIRLHTDEFMPVVCSEKCMDPGRIYTDTLQSIRDFRAALLRLGSQGCLTGPERSALLRSITERASLPSMIAYLLRFGTLGQEGFVELTDDFRLKVVTPAGSGYLIAYYSISRAPSDDRVRLTLSSATRSDQTAATAPFSAPAGFSYIRVLFWTVRSSADHFATILAAPDRAILSAATEKFLAAPDGSCRLALPGGASCIPIPPDSAVNAELRVTVNGAAAYVGIGGTLAEAIHQRSVPAGLEIRRM